MFRREKGQSTLEYIIVFTAVVGAILLAANTVVKERMKNILDHATEQAQKAVEHIDYEK